MHPTSRTNKFLLLAIVPTAILALWILLSIWKGDQTNYAIGPYKTILTLIGDWHSLWPEALRSLRRLVIGVLIGTMIGTISGILLAQLPWARLMFSPTIQVLSSIPFIVWIPFFLMALGLNEIFHLSIISLCTFLLVHGQCFHATSQLSPDYLELSKIYEKTPLQILLKVIIPAAMPSIMNATRSSFVFGWIAVAIAEKSVALNPGLGLGYYILHNWEFGLFNYVFAGAMVLALMAFIIDFVVLCIQKRVTRWCDSLENTNIGR